MSAVSPRSGWLSPIDSYKHEKTLGRAVASIDLSVRVAAFGVDAGAALTGHVMQRAVQVDAERRALAGNDPDLNAILAQYEGNFLRAANRIQYDALNGF